MDDAISRQAVLKLLSTMPPEEAITKAMLIQNVKYMSAAQPDGPDNLVKDSQGLAKDLVNDCISRKAAIDALGEDALWDSDDEYETGMHTQWSMDVDAIKALPSVQPDYKDGWIYTGKKAWEFEPCEDTISRQAAIDYFVTNVGFHDEDGYPIEDSDELRKIWTEYFDGIPSAQPDEEKISDILYYIYRNTSPHTSAEGVAATKYYIREIYREIFGEEGPGWMKK